MTIETGFMVDCPSCGHTQTLDAQSAKNCILCNTSDPFHLHKHILQVNNFYKAINYEESYQPEPSLIVKLLTVITSMVFAFVILLSSYFFISIFDNIPNEYYDTLSYILAIVLFLMSLPVSSKIYKTALAPSSSFDRRIAAERVVEDLQESRSKFLRYPHDPFYQSLWNLSAYHNWVLENVSPSHPDANAWLGLTVYFSRRLADRHDELIRIACSKRSLPVRIRALKLDDNFSFFNEYYNLQNTVREFRNGLKELGISPESVTPEILVTIAGLDLEWTMIGFKHSKSEILYAYCYTLTESSDSKKRSEEFYKSLDRFFSEEGGSKRHIEHSRMLEGMGR